MKTIGDIITVLILLVFTLALAYVIIRLVFAIIGLFA